MLRTGQIKLSGSPVTERQNQSKFAEMVGMLILKAYDLGYEVTLGEAFRPQWVADKYAEEGKGSRNSYHTRKLAIDINLFKDGKWLRDTEDHQELGEWWESIGGTWGGRFKKPDGNHYSYLE